MAHIRLNNGTTQSLSHEKAVVIWNILQGNQEPTEEQDKFCSKVHAVYLNYLNKDCPVDYIQYHREAIRQQIQHTYQSDFNGRPTRPEPSNKRVIELKRMVG